MILNEDAIFSKTCKNPVYIVLMNGKSPLLSIILSATGNYFSHACIAFNDSLDPLYSFGSKSKTIQKGGMGFCVSKPTDLTVFNKQAYYAVYVTYVTDEAYAKMKERLSYFTKNADKMIYDYIGLLNVWMHQSSDHRTRAYFYSRFVMDVIGAGVKLDKLPSLYRPQDIANMDNITLVNRGYDFHNYDKKITQKNEKLLKKGKLNTDDIIFESTIKNEPDIYYNKDKFESGEINLCFITGLSGSGKSTMANGINAEHYELDDVGFNWKFTDANLKEYGNLIYTFFTNIGKKYRISGPDEINDTYGNIYSDFVNYSIRYANSHKNIKFVVEGVQLFQWVDPNKLTDYAVYIKGTSRLISTYRAAKRNAKFENTAKNKINAVKNQIIGDLKFGKDFESRLNIWRKMFSNDQEGIREDVSSVLQKDFQSKHDMNLSQFEKMRLSDAAIQVYKQKLPSLSHVRINNNTKGYIWIDKKTDMPAAIINVEEKDDGFSWIQAFEIFTPYKGHGLSKDILNVAIRDLKATNLSVNKDNQVAIKIYKSYGFKTYKTTESMYFMSIDKNAFDNEDDEYEESALMEAKNPYSKVIKDISSTPKIEYNRKAIRSKYANIIFNSLKQQFSKKYKVCYTQVDNNYGMHDIVIYISTAVNAKEYYKSIDYGTNDYWDIIPQCTYAANKIYHIDDFNCYIILGNTIFFIYGAIVDNSGESNNTVEIDYCFDIDIVADLDTIGSKTNIEKSEALTVLQELMMNKTQDIKFDIYKDMLVFKNIDESVYNKISSKLKFPYYFNMRKVFNSKNQGTLYLISDKININESVIQEDALEIQGETGFYDRHNRWNPMVIINGENYRHRVECLIMCQNKLFVAESNDGNLLVPGGGVDKSLSDEEQVYNECKEEARILVKDIKPTGYSYIRRTGVSQSARNLPKEQQWVGSYTEVYIANYMKDFTGFIDYCDRDSEMIRGRFRGLADIDDRLLPEWKAALIDANYISITTESIKSYKDPRLALKRRMGRKRNNAIKLGDFSGVAKAAPTPQAQTVSVPSPAVSSSTPSNSAPAKQENTEEIPDNIKENANRLLCKEIAAYPKYSGHYYNMDYPLYNGQGHAIVGWKMTGVHYNDFDTFNKYRDHIYEYCSKIFSDTNPGYKLNMDKKTNCIYISEV